ncbi:MAG: hypothetical protein CVU44_15825 [Chloroflexi bacterium HGW-Chloroflexi-6]|nr:MAG: hypothetical protein CVU44_15825 [Chloroflexi bacterium HGW-Chloroflexi-6]
MKQRIQKLFKNETGLAILLIFVTTLVTYGSSIPKLGFYHDDWYLLWSGMARGAESIITLFSSDRPFMGVVYSLVYRLLGESYLNWHLYALLWRFIGGIAFFWILRLIWPEHKYMTTLMAILFVIYPGFLSQPNANTKQNHLFGFGTALLSIAFMLQTLKSNSRQWKLTFGILSFILAVNYLFIYEYMIGLEGMRLVLLGYALFQQGFRQIRSLLKEILKKWWPYPLAMAGFLYWRLFIFDSSRKATDAGRLVSDYVGNLRSMSLRLIIETVKDTLDTSIFAWFVQPYQLFANALYSNLASALLIASIVIGFVLIYSFLFKKWWEIDETEEKASLLVKDFLLLGTLIVICAVLPVVVSGREVDLGDSYKSYGLHPIGGVVMIVAGIVLMLRPNFRKLILIGLIGISVSTQALNANYWQRLWEYQRQTWWQLTWRAPDLQDDTVVMAYLPEGYRIQQDYETWGPVNLIYRPVLAEAPALQARVLNSDTAYDVLKRTVDKRFDRDVKVDADYNNLLLISFPTTASCIHVIDGTLPIYSESESLLTQQVGAYSHIDRIITSGASPIPPYQIFGSEPKRGWCYYFQKASLARQTGNWEEIVKLYEEASSLGFDPVDRSEFFPFIEAFINLGRYKEARALYIRGIKDRVKMRMPLCNALGKDLNYPPEFRYDYKMLTELICGS